MRDLMGKYRRAIIFFFVLILCVVIALPLVLDFIVENWIPQSFYSGTASLVLVWSILIAALLGGITSGWLIFIGIRATSFQQKSERFIELYPKRKRAFHAIESNMSQVIELIDQDRDVFKGKELEVFKAELDFYSTVLHQNLEESVIISGEVYSNVNLFHDAFAKIPNLISPQLSDERDGKLFVGTCILLENEREFKRVVQELKRIEPFIIQEREKVDARYQELTGY